MRSCFYDLFWGLTGRLTFFPVHDEVNQTATLSLGFIHDLYTTPFSFMDYSLSLLYAPPGLLRQFALALDVLVMILTVLIMYGGREVLCMHLGEREQASDASVKVNQFGRTPFQHFPRHCLLRQIFAT